MKRSTYNLFFGMLNQIVLLIVGLLVPKLFIENLGSEVNGLVSTINQMFGYINLLEAGIGAASLQALYMPISKTDNNGINSILSATNISYRKTALYYFLLIIVLMVVYPLIVTTDINNGVIISLIFLMGMTGVINFLFQGKYRVLLQAEGKSYVLLNIDTIIAVFVNLLKVYLIIKGYNIILVQSTQLILNLFQLIFIELYIRKHYSWIDFSVKPNFQAISQSKAVFVHQITTLVYNNTDLLILMMYTSLKQVSVFAVYNSLTTMVLNIIFQVSNSVTFLLGKFISIDTKKLLILFNAYEVFYLGFSFAVMSILSIIMLDFMSIYTANITDANYMDSLLAFFFLIKILIQAARTPYRQIIEVAGHFKKTQNRAIFEALLNLVLSLIFVNFWGVYGILLGTVLSLIYRTVDMVIYTNKIILERNILESLFPWLINSIVFILIAQFSQFYSLNTDNFITFLIKSVLVSIIVLIVYVVVNGALSYRKIQVFLKEFNMRVLLGK